MNRKFKTMVAAAMFATSIGVLADLSGSTENQTGDNYDSGAFNFTENSNQNVTSQISGGNVHGDSSANVAGNQYNCSVIGSCTSGDNSGVSSQNFTTSGNIINGGDDFISGHFVEMKVADMRWTAGEDGTFSEVRQTVTAEDVADNPDLVLGAPRFKEKQVWTAYNSTEAALIASNNSLEAQRLAANSSTKVEQTVISAPSMSAPSINASNSDMCRHGISGSVSTLGMGFSGGMTLVDKNCELVKQVRLLNNLGLSDVALSLLGQDDRIAQAMRQADPKRYGRYLNDSTEVHTEAVSANAEAVANGKEVEHSVADVDANKVNQNWNGSSSADNKKKVKRNGNKYPDGDLMNLFNW